MRSVEQACYSSEAVGKPSLRTVEDKIDPSRNPEEVMPASRIVVVGGGPAAYRLTDALTTRGLQERTLTVIGEEPHAPYDRVNLAQRWDPDHDLQLGGPQLWQAPGVRLLSSERVSSIDRTLHTVTTEAGTVIDYDELVLATGSYAWVPPVAGADLPGVHLYRTIADVDGMKKHLDSLAGKENPTAIIVGGGLLGLEAAGGLVSQGVNVQVVQLAPWLMPTQLDQGAGHALGRLISGLGVGVHNDVGPQLIERADDDTLLVTLTDDRQLAGDLVIFAVGVRPQDELVSEAGLTTGPRGGALVDEACRTSDEHIWAIGEVASLPGVGCVGLVAPANAMAEVVADRLLGGMATFPGVDTSTKLKLSGIDVAVLGDALSSTENCLDVVYADPARGVYQKLVMSDDGGTLLGGIFVGDATAYAALRPMVGRELGNEPASYLAAAGAELPGSGDLPDDAQVCSCNAVSAGTIRSAVTEHECTDVAGVKACTRAGTQCGSCVGLVQKLINNELAAAGMEIPKAVCEHFAMSRSELYEAVRVARLTTFSAIVERFGTRPAEGLNRGCDICRPMVASMLASEYSGYVLSEGRGTLQDTNDRSLANLQKDGSYSVVPRVPGGEITPAKLKVIAEVAEEFDLYTKITGGQRIDLFGARLDQLPDIWKRLIDAGMESGHAYGKALRTVKSCVGTTWCRFGVQDSVAMAIDLELRYRGLRSPHKIKMGVSGCARECAEARSKDVGVIATDQGWNLYVGGNGGFTPRHAELLVGDLSDEQLVKIIDRFVMYYVRTADRLQRTAAWIGELDGGIDHLREVILDDSLGICSDLEDAVAQHVDNYQDEWAATLADPEKLKRFRRFVNAPAGADRTIARVSERGQRRPPLEHERDSAVLACGPTIPVGAPAGEQ